MPQVTVRVPASTSNLGPGFDCLGVALRLYNRVTVRREGEKSVLPLARETGRLFFRRSGISPFSFGCTISDDVPQARGLGSSATVRAGLLLALNELSGKPLNRPALFELCAELEGHPDNAAPAFFGGFTVVTDQGIQRFQVSSRVRFVLLIPGLEISTPAARRVLPARIRHADAVQSAGNACAITAAFASQKYDALRGVMSDRLHQPFRQRLIPFLPDVIKAAEETGALGAFLSGSGSAIAALTLGPAQRIAAAMLAAAGSRKARVLIVGPDNFGAQVLRKRKVKVGNRKA